MATETVFKKLDRATDKFFRVAIHPAWLLLHIPAAFVSVNENDAWGAFATGFMIGAIIYNRIVK